MVDPRKKSYSAAQLRGKIPGQIPMTHPVLGGLRARALRANFKNFRRVGIEEGEIVQIPAQGFLYFRGRDVRAATSATSLAKNKMQGFGQGCCQV